MLYNLGLIYFEGEYNSTGNEILLFSMHYRSSKLLLSKHSILLARQKSVDHLPCSHEVGPQSISRSSPQNVLTSAKRSGGRNLKVIASILSTALLFTFVFSFLKMTQRVLHSSNRIFFKNNLGTEAKAIPLIVLSEVNGGTIYRIPSSYNRLHTPWIERPRIKLLSPKESNYRYLYSPVRRGSSDGIGHSMGVVNMDLNLAFRFNITYTHRVADYSSLTKNDRFAVEHFFGWGDDEVPRALIQKEGCTFSNGSWPSAHSLYECFPCDTPRLRGALRIKQFINIPTNLSRLCPLRSTCSEETGQFLKKHSQSHTIFQVPQPICAPPLTDGSLLHTKNFFYHKYWTRHGNLVWSPASFKKKLSTVRYDQSELHIAMHVRRGDILDPETRRTHDIISDITYATVLQNVLIGIRQVKSAFAKLPIVVHIYSEGKLIKNRVPSTHDMDVQDKLYYDSRGVVRNISWWENLVFLHGQLKGREAAQLVKNRLRFSLHISEDTLQSAHEMIAADVFIGSKSALSLHLVWSMSRGVVVVPRSGTSGMEISRLGLICCTVPFGKDDGDLSLSLFRRYWGAYVRANEDTIQKFSIFANFTN